MISQTIFKKLANNSQNWISTAGVSESTFASLTTGKMVVVLDAWSNMVVPILLMSNGFVLGAMCNKTIRV